MLWTHNKSRNAGMLAVALMSVTLLMGTGPCEQAAEATGCKADNDCDPGFLCQREIGVCRCRTDDACGANEYCNSAGGCQPRPPCLSNQDCESGSICNSADASGGSCIPADQCGTSIHCDFNQYCNPETHHCVPGCRNIGDCQLGWVCENNTCVTSGTPSDCTTCPIAPNLDASYCDYGETCSAEGSCVAHPKRDKLCNTCDPTHACSNGLTCLVDDETAGGYCSPTCNTIADCPNGYGTCGGLILVSQMCSRDSDCSNGGRCLGGDEVNRGFCECKSQSDCSTMPICMSGHCLGSDLACSNNNDCTATCVQTPAGNGIMVGVCETNTKTCGKPTGVTCQTLKTEPAACRALTDL